MLCCRAAVLACIARSLELSSKLEWQQRRYEEAETAIADLHENKAELIAQNTSLQAYAPAALAFRSSSKRTSPLHARCL